MKTLILSLTLLLFLSCKKESKDKTELVEVDLSKLREVTGIDSSKNYLKESELRNYIKLAPKISQNKNNQTPFDTLQYDKVIAYDFEGSGEPYRSIFGKDGLFVPVILKQQALNRKQVDKLIRILTSNSTYGNVGASCFDPHLGIIFYKDDKIIGEIDICLDCDRAYPRGFEIPAQSYHKINKGTENEYEASGLSESGQKKISNFCKDLDFYYGRTFQNPAK